MDQNPTLLLDIPVEIHVQILKLVETVDVLSYARCCKAFRKYSDSQQVWKCQWIKLSRKTPFTFLPVSSLVKLDVNFKDACRRLWRILVTEGAFGGLTPAKCIYCREFTCINACIGERSSSRVTIDIGNKITWLITSNFSLKRHLSMMAVPKLLKCYDCDTTINRNEYHLSQPTHDLSPSLAMLSGRYCHSRVMSSHTALEYCSQALADVGAQSSTSQPFCLFCEEEKLRLMLCERDMVSETKHKMKGVRPPYMSVTGEEDFLNYSALSPLTNGYCRDTAFILGAHNLDLLSPLLAMEHEGAFSVVREFLTHLLKEYKLIGDLQRPTSSLVLTVGRIPQAVKEALLKFFFEEVKIARLCLLPKGLAVAKLFEVNTCIVVDSGALSTLVYVVVDGQVDETRTQSMNVGGWHVSQFLKQSLTWKDNKDAVGTTVSSLDASGVKQKCWLSLNLSREGIVNYRSAAMGGDFTTGAIGGATASHGVYGSASAFDPASRAETLQVKSKRDNHRWLEMKEITLSSELYLAPEMMYASLDLPGMVQEATKDLPDHLIKDCFSNILVTGGNTDLKGFVQRFSSDLRKLLPEHSPIINVCPYPTGNHSWNTVMGATAVLAPMPYEGILEPHNEGRPLWLMREEYISFGSQYLATSQVHSMEG